MSSVETSAFIKKLASPGIIIISFYFPYEYNNIQIPQNNFLRVNDLYMLFNKFFKFYVLFETFF